MQTTEGYCGCPESAKARANDINIDVKSKTKESLKIWLVLQNVKLYKY
jgi:hypothetical protein